MKSSSEVHRQFEEELLQAFEPDLGAIMARCVIRVALARLAMELASLQPAQVPSLATELKRGLRLYAPDAVDTCMRRILPVLDRMALPPARHKKALQGQETEGALAGKTTRAFNGVANSESPMGSQCLHIESEADILLARHAVREMCGRLGFSRSEEVKAATVVSELARNIVLYAKRGEINVRRWLEDGRVGIEIRARDQGPGIPNMDVILSGNYRSKTGLGLGILGTKRLAHQFEIVSGVGGTEIVARMVVR